MGAIDVLAVILSVIVLIKIGVIFLAGPKVWLKVPQFLLKHKEATVVVYSLGGACKRLLSLNYPFSYRSYGGSFIWLASAGNEFNALLRRIIENCSEINA